MLKKRVKRAAMTKEVRKALMLRVAMRPARRVRPKDPHKPHPKDLHRLQRHLQVAAVALVAADQIPILIKTAVLIFNNKPHS